MLDFKIIARKKHQAEMSSWEMMQLKLQGKDDGNVFKFRI
jgi:hypothetical protein